MDVFDAGNGVPEKARDGARKMFAWMDEHPDEFRECIERGFREWPEKRRKAAKYIRKLERCGVAKLPDGLTEHDIERARLELASSKYRGEARWSAIGKIANVAAIVGSLAAVATLVITVLLGWFV